MSAKLRVIACLSLAIVMVMPFGNHASAVRLKPAPTRLPLPSENHLQGTTSSGRCAVKEDNLLPFSIYTGPRVGGGPVPELIYKANMQARVCQYQKSRRIEFSFRIRDAAQEVGGELQRVCVSGFTGLPADVEFSSSSLGSVGPITAYRTGKNGKSICFHFNGLTAAASTHFFYIMTDLTCLPSALP